MSALYDSTKEYSYILFIDANNLYGGTMSQALLIEHYALLCDAAVCTAKRTLISDNKATSIGFFDMAASVRRELVGAVNTKLNGVISDPQVKKLVF